MAQTTQTKPRSRPMTLKLYDLLSGEWVWGAALALAGLLFWTALNGGM